MDHPGRVQLQTSLKPTAVSLPFDVLSKIFFDCLPDRRFPRASCREAPLLLCRVCSDWRRVALASHRLWAKLSVMKNYGTILTNPSSAIVEWISRAGKCALSFQFDSARFSADEWIEVITSILPYRERWGHIAGRLSGEQWRLVYSAISEGAPLLQYIYISLFAKRRMGLDHPEIRLSATPILRNLTLRPHHRILGLEACNRSLQHLSVCVQSLNECWSYLIHCPNVEVFRLKGGRLAREPICMGSGVLERRRMVTLELAVPFAGPLLDQLHLPVLKSLCFGSGEAGSVVSSFLLRHRPPLVSFTLSDSANNFLSDDLFDCLRLCPALTTLVVGERTRLDNADIVQLKLGLQGGENICPRLEEIGIGCVHGNVSYLEDMVVSRWKGADKAVPSTTLKGMNSTQSYQWERNLRKISLGICYFRELEYIGNNSSAFTERRRIAKCIEEGLDIIVDKGQCT
ncbi:hypothetical protein BD410DRAFT_359622 [Rickenella mellea]|uniref:Uncharacterized protein n=1 Tax=Rickenella mellea TaxID=50990 RepID=A0A4Y7Q103_9AGAM|nr:hypothetical protein BD410DRAFT_359622 [Rickenella mellea]